MQNKLLKNLIKDKRQIKKLKTFQDPNQFGSIPILIRNKSCECQECGGSVKKQIEEYQLNQMNDLKFIPKYIAQHEQIKFEDISQSNEMKTKKNYLYLITPKRNLLQNTNISEQPLFSPTLEQPKRDIQKLHRLIEKYESKIEINIKQICKTMPDVVANPKQKTKIQRQKTKYHSFIKILPLEDEVELQNNYYVTSSNSQQKTPLRAQVYKELKGSTILQQLQTPIFQKSKFNKNEIIDFADGMKKAMERIKEMDELSNTSKMISTQINDENKILSRQSLLLKSFLDCTKLIEKDPKFIKQLNVFQRSQPIPSKQIKHTKLYSYQNVFLPKIKIK